MNLHWLGPKLQGILAYYEIKQATTLIIKLVQMEYFRSEYKKKLENGENIDIHSRLSSLSPFLDSQGLIRAGGRLQHSNLSFEQKHQIVLPNNHHFTNLLVRYERNKYFHAGLQNMRSILRRNYWILRHEVAIQRCILKCVKCIRLKADTRSQMMASLPKSRVVPARAFLNVGVDYAGLVRLLARPGRGKHKIGKKVYIAVFVCFTTKALHLELVFDLTKESFLAAFERFIGRRTIYWPTRSSSRNMLR